jgi:hypothetical protein
MQSLEATAIHLVLASRPGKIVESYFSPTRPLIDFDMNACLSGGLPVLMAGDLNAKHTEWNFRLIFEKILLTRVLREVNERCLLRDEQFRFRLRHSTALQLARLVERVYREFYERRLTGAVFLDLDKAFDTVWAEGLLDRLTILNFPSYLLKTLSSYLHHRTFQTSFKSATSTRRTMRVE